MGSFFTSFLSNIISVKILEKQKLFLYISLMLKNRFSYIKYALQSYLFLILYIP